MATMVSKGVKGPSAEVFDAALAASKGAANRVTSPQATGVSTALDTRVGALTSGDLLLVAGRAGVGTSAFLLQAAMRLAQGGSSVVLVSPGESPVRLAQRLVAALAQVPIADVVTGRTDTTGRASVESAAHLLREFDVTFLCDDGTTVGEVSDEVAGHRPMREGDRTVVVVDDVAALRPDRGRPDRNQEVADVARSLRSIASSQGAYVVAGAHLSRPEKLREPRVSDFLDGGVLADLADSVVLLDRSTSTSESQKPGRPVRGTMEARVVKARYGSPAVVPLRFDGTCGTVSQSESLPREL